MVIGTDLGWGEFATIALAVVLALFFGYSLTLVPLLRSGLALDAVLVVIPGGRLSCRVVL